MNPLPLPLPFHADGVVLRALRPSDLTQFLGYRSDARLAVYQGWSPMSEDQARAFLAEMASVTALVPGQWVQLGMALPGPDRLVGDIGLHLDETLGTVELGYTLAREHHGQGLATRAVLAAVACVFASTTVDRLRAVTDARNEASIRLLERSGFGQVSEHQAVFKGETCTELVFERRKATMSEGYVCLWEFLVLPASDAEFRKHYGPEGVWSELFRRHPGYLETLLLVDPATPGRYLTLDRWQSEEAYRAFKEKAAGDYAELDRRCEHLTLREVDLGSYRALAP